jgi:hypothetical protein
MPVGFELKANEVTPPPPGMRLLASVPVGAPTIPVRTGVAWTGARKRTLLPGSLRNMPELQARYGRRVRDGSVALATRCAVTDPRAGLGPVTSAASVGLFQEKREVGCMPGPGT